MENAPSIIIFWYLLITIFVFMFVSLIAAIKLTKSGKENKRRLFLGKVCVIFSIMCASPIILVVGYVVLPVLVKIH